MSEAAKQEVGRLIAALPPTVSVDGLVLDITIVDEIKEGDAWGMYRGLTQEIKIVRDLPTPEKLAQVVFHEVCHAVIYYRDIVDHSKIVARDEEHLVDAFSTGMTAVFAYNKWLLPWLLECLTWRSKTV